MQSPSALLRRACDLAIGRKTSSALRQFIESLETRRMLDAAPKVIGATFDYAHAPHALRVQFDQDVSASLAVSDFIITQDASDQVEPAARFQQISFDTATNTATLLRKTTSPIYSDGSFHLTLLPTGVTNSSDQTLQSPFDFRFFSFQADLNHDRVVDNTDWSIVHSHLGQTGTYSQGDENYDGTIDEDDQADVEAAFVNPLPLNSPPPAGLTVLTSGTDQRHLYWVDNSVGEGG